MPPLFRSDRPAARAPALMVQGALVAGVALGSFLAILKEGLLWRDALVNGALPLSAPPMAFGAVIGGDAAGRLASVGAETRTAAATRAAPPPPPPPAPPPPSPPPAHDTAAALRAAGTPPLAPASYASIASAVAHLGQSTVPSVPLRCHARANSDLGGELAGGAPHGDANQKDDAGGCCAACEAHTGAPRCNVWVWNRLTRACWLKHAALYPERPYVYYSADSPWTGGSLFDYGPSYDARNASAVAAATGTAVGATPPPTCIHTVLTSNGNSYMNWQTRVMYATWQAAASAAGPDAVMTVFTRVLHRGSDDELMTEVPTQRFAPARPECDTYCDFPVSDRSVALAQWALTPDAARCSHVLMVETDYLFVRAVPRHVLPTRGHAVGFHFGYIVPTSIAGVSRRFFPESMGSLETVAQTGNAPQLLTAADFRAIMPAWVAMQRRIDADAEAVKEYNWVRDMYGYTFAASQLGIRHHVPLVPFNSLMVQPPADVALGEAALLHYTWGPIVSVDGVVLWQFDKRSYGGGQGAQGPVRLVKLERPPAWRQGMRLQANETVTPDGLALMTLLVDTFNAAVEGLPELPRGWTTLPEAQEAARPKTNAAG